MTVRELRKLLKREEQDLDVYVNDSVVVRDPEITRMQVTRGIHNEPRIALSDEGEEVLVL